MSDDDVRIKDYADRIFALNEKHLDQRIGDQKEATAIALSAQKDATAIALSAQKDATAIALAGTKEATAIALAATEKSQERAIRIVLLIFSILTATVIAIGAVVAIVEWVKPPK